MEHGFPCRLVIHAMVFKKGVVFGGRHCIDDKIGETGYGNPYPELAVVEEGQEGAVLIKDLGSGGRSVVFQGGNIRQVGKDPHGPQNNDEDAQSESSESGKKILFHVTAIFSPHRVAGEGPRPSYRGDLVSGLSPRPC